MLRPLTRSDPMWRAYMARHRQNHPHQYHNGGLWPFVGGFWVLALAQANAADDWRFTEWFHGRTLAPMGMAGQSWNAATGDLLIPCHD